MYELPEAACVAMGTGFYGSDASKGFMGDFLLPDSRVRWLPGSILPILAPDLSDQPLIH